MSSKKDYKAIAEMIDLCRVHNVTLENPDHQQYEHGINSGCQDMAYRLADYFESDNPQFDRLKFFDACFKD